MADSIPTYAPLPVTDGGAVSPDPPRRRRLLSLAAVSIVILGLTVILAGGPWGVNEPQVPESEPCLVILGSSPGRGVREGVSDKSSGALVREGVSDKSSGALVREGVSDKSSGAFLRSGPCPFSWSNDMLLWQRTGFHFQPENNWMNDPNGPLFYKGWYHLFYQYNPDSALWGNITWGHAISRDLLHWLHLPLAMVADQWYDSNGVWTGSATFLPNGQIVMLYTGSTNASVQVQNLAYPADLNDPLLLKWVKSDANPVLVPPSNVLPKDFRDPTTAWFEPADSTWRMAIGSKDTVHAGVTYIYKTKDFIHYDLLPGSLHRVIGTGMWECVDFYPISTGASASDGGPTEKEGLDTSVRPGLGVKHVLKASMDDDRHDYYAIGTYEPETNKWLPDDVEADVGFGLRYDWGKFYASKTFYDQNKRRRVLWGWIGETDSERTDVQKGWASLQGIPRTVLLDVKTESNLLQWPVEEVERLRTASKDFSEIRIDSGSVFRLDLPSATQLDIEAEFEIEPTATVAMIEADIGYNCSTSGGAAARGALGPFGLLVLADEVLSEQTATYFYVSRGVDGRLWTHFCQDELRSSKANDIVKSVVGSTVPVLDGERLSLRILVDHSIIESFAQGGRSTITSRVYPTTAIYSAAQVYLFNNATNAFVTAKSLKIWQMNSTFIHTYTVES